LLTSQKFFSENIKNFVAILIVVFSVYPDCEEQVHSLEKSRKRKICKIAFNGYNNIEKQVASRELTQNG